MLNNEDVAINLALFKWFRLYHIFDPNETKIFGRNVYWLTYLIISAISQCVLIYVTLGYILSVENVMIDVNYLQLIPVYLSSYLIQWKIYMFLYNADTIWEILDVTRLNFLTSKQCIENNTLLTDRYKTIRITNMYFFFSCAIAIQWIMFPILTYLFLKTENSNNQHIDNILNFQLFVNKQTYYQYYTIFYTIESLVLMYLLFSFIMFDIFIMSICRIITTHYNVIAHAFGSIGNGDEPQLDIINNCNEEYDNFKSILFDQLQLYLKLKSFYSCIWKIILVEVAFISASMIVMMYTLVVICTSVKLFSILNVIKIASSIIYSSFRLFFICYLFNDINIAKESVNFGIYSCNWTRMNLKFKKLILLAMRMNDTNQFMLRASPKKIISLQLFTDVMIKNYNVVSVLINILKNKNEEF